MENTRTEVNDSFEVMDLNDLTPEGVLALAMEECVHYTCDGDFMNLKKPNEVLHKIQTGPAARLKCPMRINIFWDPKRMIELEYIKDGESFPARRSRDIDILAVTVSSPEATQLLGDELFFKNCSIDICSFAGILHQIRDKFEDFNFNFEVRKIANLIINTKTGHMEIRDIPSI